ncbi:DUF3999 family protein [Saccharibacillus qingshengii]|uniref:DUF3999 family protein n=1 Tax=Saccharibacillus qingshengii TaxID=1763540 RepID=UPI0015578842|nr:DUF3999 family protein [Saccharibacillus qingshengii]
MGKYGSGFAKKKLGAALCAAALLGALAGLPESRAQQASGSAGVERSPDLAEESVGNRLEAAAFSARPQEEEAESGTWAFAKEIRLADVSRYQALYLDADVYGRSQENLGDVRIVDASGRFVPYYTDSGEEGKRGLDRYYPLELIKSTPGKDVTRFDFRVIPASNPENFRGSRLTFPLSKGPFLKKIRVEGSKDGKGWEPVTEGELYTDGETKFRNVIELDEPAGYGYYRLNVPNAGGKIELTDGMLSDVGAAVSGQAFRRAKELPFNVETLARMSEVVIYNADRLRIDQIRLKASASDGSGEFSRIFYVNRAKGTGANTRILSPTRLNRLQLNGLSVEDTQIRLAEPILNEKPRVVIDNAGNPPLNIEAVEVGYRVDRLIFEDTGAGPYRLLYGAEGQEKPQYDTEALRTGIVSPAPAQAQLGREEAAAFAAPDADPLSGAEGAEPVQAEPGPIVGAGDSLRILLYIVLGGVGLLLIAVLSRKLRKK